MAQLVKNRRIKRLLVYYTEEEFNSLQKFFFQSNCRYLAVYVRKLSLRSPVEISWRNASFDDFIGEIIPLRKEMAAIRRAGNLTPENQAELIRLHESIQVMIDKIAKICMQQ